MEIDVTAFIANEDMYDFSHSEAEHCGPPGTAGAQTYAAALAAAERYPYVTDENRAAFDSWCRDFGAWEAEEIAGWSNVECTALLLQFVAGDARQFSREDFDQENDGGAFYAVGADHTIAAQIIRHGDFEAEPECTFHYYMGH